MARPKRFELLTPRFVVWCSIQLSYGRVVRIAPEFWRDARAEPGAKAPGTGHSYRVRSGMAREAKTGGVDGVYAIARAA